MSAVMERVRSIFGDRVADRVATVTEDPTEVRLNQGKAIDTVEVDHSNDAGETVTTKLPVGLNMGAIGLSSEEQRFVETQQLAMAGVDVRRYIDGEVFTPFSRAIKPELGPLRVPEKPSTAMLRHMILPELGTDPRQALAVEVEDKLGYKPLRTHTGAPSRLQRILRELEIDAFDSVTVEEYKAKMQAHFQALASERDRKTNEARGEAQTESYARLIGVPVEVATRMPLSFFGSITVRTHVGWSMVKLSDYAKPVPEFVLNKCVQIKDRAPEARFWVNELREDQQTLDPFLYVTLGKGNPDSADVESAVIEVWDEPEFEHKL